MAIHDYSHMGRGSKGKVDLRGRSLKMDHIMITNLPPNNKDHSYNLKLIVTLSNCSCLAKSL